MNLVFSFDAGYISPFKVLLHSISLSNPGEIFDLYLLHDEMKQVDLDELQQVVENYGFRFHPINCRPMIEESEEVTINRYYTIEMYLWLFAPYFLPKEVERALYLDPDIINLNPLKRFYDLDFEENLFVAMDYEVKTNMIQPFNNLRLRTYQAEHYFNTGVVLMNMDKLRRERKPEEITDAVIKNKAILILPDQDVFNHLYFGQVKAADWEFYNLDPRLYQVFQLVKPEVYNQKWVEDEVVFIHYCGKRKPWIEREKYKMDLGHYYFENEKQLKQTTIESSVNR